MVERAIVGLPTIVPGPSRSPCDAFPRPCRGKLGCRLTDAGQPHCDDSVAREGDRCVPAGQSACSEDGKWELACTDGGFVRSRECRGACVSDEATLRCP